ncbi:MAG TPA: Uma2 family endonuclease [Thermoanaerobaculia bacterium]|nr:Uma2 family endonuclease [Thermoanaerobaculia bacterium]
MVVASAEIHRWTREEYERMAAKGFFPPDARVELIEGIVYDTTPQSSFHSTSVYMLHERLRAVFTEGVIVRNQSPLVLGEDSEPEPDLAVVPGSAEDYLFAHPTTAVLVVEVADSSLLRDRRLKIPLYARAGVPEAWLLNLKRTVLEAYRDPAEGVYRSRTVLRPGESVSPLARPDVSLAVGDFFPWERSARKP